MIHVPLLHQISCQQGGPSTLTLSQISGRIWKVQKWQEWEQVLSFSKTHIWDFKAAARHPCGPSLQFMVLENIQQFLPPIYFAMQPVSYLNCQAVLNDLELIFHLDAPCQYKPIGIKAQKNRWHPMSAVCFVYWELLFLYFQGFLVFFFVCLGLLFLFEVFSLFGFGFGWFVVFIVDVAFWGWTKTSISISFPCRLKLGGSMCLGKKSQAITVLSFFD